MSELYIQTTNKLVRENRLWSGKSQGILLYSNCGHPVNGRVNLVLYQNFIGLI